MNWSWPGQEALRDLVKRVSGKSEDVVDDGLERFTVELALAPYGSAERVRQLKEVKNTMQRLVEDAAAAYRDNLG